MRRLNAVAHEALKKYGLGTARLTFLTYHGNAIYRVDKLSATTRRLKGGPFVPGRWVLRIHMPYHSAAEIRSEHEWLSALRRDADLPVPEPVPTKDGQLLFEADIPGSSGCRFVSLLRWLDGRFYPNRLTPARARAWGRLMAQLHEHTSQWRRPAGFTRRHRDWNGLFGKGAGFEYPADELWEAVPKRFQDAFQDVTDGLRKVMRKLGKGPDVYGLVHADLGVNTNVLFKGGEARVIDFDDSAYAYWLHDLAFALSPWVGNRHLPWVRETLLEGYAEVRSLPESQLKYLDLFMAGFQANLLLWMIDWAKLQPRSERPRKAIRHHGENLLRYYRS